MACSIQWLSPLNQQFVANHRHTVSQKTLKKLDRPSIDQHVSMLCFYKTIRTSNSFCAHNILTEGVFLTHVSSNAGIPLWWIVGYDELPFHERHVTCTYIQLRQITSRVTGSTASIPAGRHFLPALQEPFISAWWYLVITRSKRL